MSVRGIQDLADLIDLLKNPAKYDEKISQLRGEIERYNAAIESVVKLDSVNEYTINIKNKSEAIDKEYEQAKANSAQLLAATKLEVEAAKAEIKKAQDKIKAKELLIKATEETQLANAKYQTEFAEKLEKKANELSAKEAQLDALEKELAERKAKLLAALG